MTKLRILYHNRIYQEICLPQIMEEDSIVD